MSKLGARRARGSSRPSCTRTLVPRSVIGGKCGGSALGMPPAGLKMLVRTRMLGGMGEALRGLDFKVELRLLLSTPEDFKLQAAARSSEQDRVTLES